MRERGFDFAFAARIFRAPVLVIPDVRRDYGEPRFLAIGRVAGITLSVIFTDRPPRRPPSVSFVD